ncbi:hypothetical protein, partial [Thermococcus celericrescens]|uniref:hypothetical protein n=1 Tax=Thermococcus celericrescens TaxID=227598 RepID=UPI000AEC79A0
MKRLLLIGILLGALLPLSAGAQTPTYGMLTITGDIEEVSVQGIGVYPTPVTLVLPVGNYTVRAGSQIELEARVFLNASKLVEVEFRKGNPGELVEGNLTILGVKVTYDWLKNYPKYSSPLSLGLPGGCGWGWSPFYYTNRPLPMTLVDVGDRAAKLFLNGTVVSSSYIIVGPFGVFSTSVKSASFIVPLSEVRVTADVEYVEGYLYNVSSASMVTPFTLILPVVPHDVYDVTGTTTDGDVIRINHIPKVDTYNLSVGVNHTLVTAVVRLRPGKRYGISYSLRTALGLIRVREESVALYRVSVNTTPRA